MAADSNELESKYNRAQAYAQRGMYAEATPLFEELHKLFPQAPEISLALIACYQSLNRFDKSKVVFETIEKNGVEDSLNYLLLEGSFCLEQGNAERALTVFHKAKKLIGDSTMLNLEVGRSFLRLQAWSDAESCFRTVLGNDHLNVPANHGLGQSLLYQDKYEKAAKALRTAIALRYELPLAHYHLSQALFHLMDFRKSAQTLEDCLNLAPSMAQARYNLVIIYTKYIDEPQKAAFHKQYLENN